MSPGRREPNRTSDRQAADRDSGDRASVADLWQQVLRVDTVAPEDDFFKLGGNSMQAVRLLVAVSTQVGRQLEYERFFASPTFATLTDLVRSGEPQ